jgi:hypothetical protein
VGDVATEGEGNGKKVSKKKAAEKMVDELKKITPPSPSTTENLKQKRKVSVRSLFHLHFYNLCIVMNFFR